MNLILYLLLTCNSWAQIPPDPNLFPIQDLSGGLNTYNNPLLLQDNQGQVVKNVLLDKTGSVTRRPGWTIINPTAIGTGVNDVNAVYKLETSGGTKYCVAFSSATGSYSTDGCQTFTTFVSTLTPGADVNCDAMQDRLYCVNGNYNFYFDGTNNIQFTAPAGLTIIRVHHSRCFAAGATGNPYRLFYSVLGDCTQWNTATDYVDISPNDGDAITGIGPTFYDQLPIYKNYSAYALRGSSNNDFVLVTIDRSIGAKNHRTIQNLFQIQLFDSLGPNGGQPGIYGFDGVTVQEMSKNLRNDLDKIDTFRAAVNRKTITTQADWQAGTFDPNAMSAVRTSGFMQSSFTLITDGFVTDSSSVTISTVDVIGSLRLARSTFSITNGTFTTGDFTNWTNSGWTVTSDNIGTACPQAEPVSAGNARGPNAGGSRSMSIDARDQKGVVIKTCTINYDANCNYTNSNCDIDIQTPTLGANYRTAGPKITNFYNYTAMSMRFTDLQSGQPYIQTISSGPAQNAVGSVVCVFNGATSQGSFAAKVCNTANFFVSGNYTSNAFDTSLSTPIGGAFNVSESSNSEATATFQTQVATSPSGAWNTLVTVTPGNQIILSGNRYERHKVTFATTVASKTAEVDLLQFSAASTGTWLSPELLLSKNMTAWGNFQTVQNTNGGATLLYNIRSSTYQNGTQYNTWTSITPGSAITLSTGAYFQILSTFTITAATETDNVNVITINWKEGTQAKSASAAVFQNRYHYGAQSLNGSINDTMYILDSRGAWVKWDDVRPRMLNVINQQLMMADSTTTSAGNIIQLYNSESDNGNGFNSEFRTKDYAFGNLFHRKAVDRIMLMNATNNSSLNVDLIADTNQSTATYTFNLSTGMAYGMQQQYIQPPLTGNVFNLRFYNSAASQPWQLNAAAMQVRDLGLQEPLGGN